MLLFVVYIIILGVILILLEKFISIPPIPATLHLRSFPASENLSWYDCYSNNMFANELCDQYLVVSVPLDLGVMVYTKDIQILSKQEDQHSIMHTKLMKDHPAVLRYKFWKNQMKIVLLKTPVWLSENILGVIETSFGNGVWVCQKILGKFWSNICIFHWFEESEHGVITSAEFKRRYNPLVRLLLCPIGLICLIHLWILPIGMKLYYEPRLFRSLKMYLDLGIYLITVVVAVSLHVFETVLYWLLPFKRPECYYQMVKNELEEQVKERQIEFKIIDQKEYYY